MNETLKTFEVFICLTVIVALIVGMIYEKWRSAQDAKNEKTIGEQAEEIVHAQNKADVDKMPLADVDAELARRDTAGKPQT